MRPTATGVLDNGIDFRKKLPDHITLPQYFSQQGYRVARIGKLYHYNVPTQIGTNGLDDSRSWQEVINPKGRDVADEDRTFSVLPGHFGASVSWLAADGEDEAQTDGIAATEAVRWLEKHQHEPFFLAVGFFRPHTPYVAPKKYFDMYPLEKIQLPEEPADLRDQVPAMALSGPSVYRLKGHEKMTDLQRRQAIQAYYAATTFMDAQLGRVLDAVERLKLAKNTVIVFTSDHGVHLYEHGLWHKRTLFEESTRVPLVICAPESNARGKSIVQPVELIDLYPTLADLCGLPVPKDLSGISLKPVVDNAQAKTKPAALMQVMRGKTRSGYSICTDRWRYTEWDDGKAGQELYDHQSDPREHRNLADDPIHAEKRAELQTLLAKLKSGK
jgi:uncharacterized sulfatase